MNTPNSSSQEPRIGILGGSFDPPHKGHLAVAKAALEALSLDEVILLPTNRNPLKKTRTAPSEHRMEMTKLLVRKEPNVAVSDIEITRGGVSYAVDTVAELQMVQPSQYWFIMGSDALKELEAWKSPERLMKMCRIAVVNRNPAKGFVFPHGFPEEFKPFIDVVPMPYNSASSTEVRERILKKSDLSAFLPEAVISYIRANKLYQI
jgi:nicotinate-nucleotide adenylyltransferase